MSERWTPSSAVAFQEQHLRETLRRERESNRVFRRHCPGIHETRCYQASARPTSSFYTTAEYLRHQIAREHARFNPRAPCPVRLVASPRERALFCRVRDTRR
jgi:hypothetical protein